MHIYRSHQALTEAVRPGFLYHFPVAEGQKTISLMAFWNAQTAFLPLDEYDAHTMRIETLESQ